jgi:hypothetical protein
MDQYINGTEIYSTEIHTRALDRIPGFVFGVGERK